MAARLAAWRRVTQQGVILYVMDGHAACPDVPHHLPRSVAGLLLNVHKKRHELRPWTKYLKRHQTLNVVFS